MGLGKWWMTYGPGSPGSVAKRMAVSYSLLKRGAAGASHDDLLLMTLRARYNAAEIPDHAAAQMVAASEGQLAKLTLQVLQLENPRVSMAAMRAPTVYEEVIEIIRDVTARHAPGAS